MSVGERKERNARAKGPSFLQPILLYAINKDYTFINTCNIQDEDVLSRSQETYTTVVLTFNKDGP